jgi:hypothetical protein
MREAPNQKQLPREARNADFERTRWQLHSRRRRLRIGDMMAVVVITAIGLAAVTLPELDGGGRVLLGVVAILCLGLQWAQWGLASVRVMHPAINGLLVALSFIVTLSIFICVVVLGLIFPHVGAFLSVTMLIFGVYLTTWA